MRFDPHFVTNLSTSLAQSSFNEQQLTTELSSGLRVGQLSDDPVAIAQSTLLSSQISKLDSFTASAATDQGLLQVTDSTLGQVVSSLTSAISLATAAGNATLNPADLASLGQQVAGIRDQILSLANTSYQGKYIFSGSTGNILPFTLNTGSTPAQATYHGDNGVQTVVTPSGQSIQLNVPGSGIFNVVPRDLLGTLNNLVADLAAGNTNATSGSSTATLSFILTQVSAQRSILDTSINQLTSTAGYAATQSTELQAQRSELIAADPAQIATGLQTAEVQHQALLSVIASLGKTNLFSYLQ